MKEEKFLEQEDISEQQIIKLQLDICINTVLLQIFWSCKRFTRRQRII